MTCVYSFRAQISNEAFDTNTTQIEKYDPFYVTVANIEHMETEIEIPDYEFEGKCYMTKNHEQVRTIRRTKLRIKEHGRSLWLLGTHKLKPLDILYVTDWTRSRLRIKNKKTNQYEYRYVLLIHGYTKTGWWESDEHYFSAR